MPNQSQTLFAVADFKQEDEYNVEFGVGHGFTQKSDDLVIKLMIGFGF